MDKYEYKLKTEQMLELMEDGAYRKAAAIADEIDWKRVRNASMLTNVSDIYEKNKEYDKSYSILNLAYRRAEGSRKIISRLCTLALKTGNVDEAIDYYDDFVQLAPKDPNQYILRYQILRAQRAPIEQQIEALEEYKKSEYIEEWAYELAKLYQEAGMTAECLEECDDLILWFSEGQYVYKAMELKMQYKPLTPSQQEKYDRRYEKLSSETEEMPDLISYAESKTEDSQKESAQDVEEVSDTSDGSVAESEDTKADTALSDGEKDNAEAAPVQEQKASDVSVNEETEPKRKKLGDTMPLGEALRRLLHPGSGTDELKSEEPDDESILPDNPEEIEEPELDDLEKEIGEIESVADIEMVNRIAEEKRSISVSGEMTEIIPEDIDLSETAELLLEDAEPDDLDPEELGESEPEELDEEIVPGDSEEEELDSESEELTTEEEKPGPVDKQITGQMSLEDILAGWEGEPDQDTEEQTDSIEEEISEEIVLDDAEDIAEEIITEGETTGENMEEKKKEEPILPPDIQRLIDEIEGVIPREDEKKPEPERRERLRKKEEPRENMGKVADSLRIDDEEDYFEEEFDDEEDLLEAEELEDSEEYFEEEDEELEDSEEYFEEEDEELGDGEEYFEEEDEELEDGDEYFEEEDEELEDGEEYFEEEDEELEDGEEYFEEEDEELEDGEEYFEEEDEELEDSEEYFEEADEESLDMEGSEFDEDVPDIDEEFRVNPEHAEMEDDREIPDDDDDGMDILSATTPLSRKETAKMIATGKTAPLPLDEISDALSMSDTGFIVHGRYDLELQSGIGTRAGLTEEQKKLFSYFVPVRGMSEQLVDVLEQDKNCTNRNGTSKAGNLLIIGNKGNGKTVLAVDVVKAIQKQRDIRQGKVAIVTGDSLNKKKIGDIVEKLYGGALIIEKAGKMNEKTVARLNKAMEQDTGEMLIVLEEQRKPLDRLLSSNREFRRKFTSRLEIPLFINDELVTFGQTYAQENGYRIDEMGILALYSRIDSLQREDHAVTVAEVKEIMDGAIQHSQKASAKKLMKRVFGKNTDEADRIILSEKDFNI